MDMPGESARDRMKGNPYAEDVSSYFSTNHSREKSKPQEKPEDIGSGWWFMNLVGNRVVFAVGRYGFPP
jgi:hypothetical protein